MQTRGLNSWNCRLQSEEATMEDSSTTPNIQYGLESFVSNHAGFSGLIKREYDDFIVNEIDINGQIINIDNTNYDIASFAYPKSVKLCRGDKDTVSDTNQPEFVGASSLEAESRSKCKMASSSEVVASNKGCEPCGDNATVEQFSNLTNASVDKFSTGNEDEIKMECNENLQQILGHDIFEKLALFADSAFKHSINQLGKTESEGTCDRPIDSETFVIGTFSSKEIRTKIHSNVKNQFPHLCTKVEKASDGDGLCIIVQSDPVYWNFYQSLNTNEVDGFIRFVDEKDSSKTFSLRCPESKQERTLIHRLVAKHFGAFLETKTFTGNDNKIVVRFRQKFQQRSQERRGQKRKAADQVSIVTGFVLRKENLEMLDAINRLASALRTHPSNFSYAGIKDKKAITTQVMSVRGLSPQKLKGCLDEKEIPGIQISSIQSIQEPIQMGQLSGNHFEIVIRDVRLKTKDDGSTTDVLTRVRCEIGQAVENVKANMFLNYFGQQRFGSSSDIEGNAASIGLLILKKQYVAAVKQLLAPIQGKEDPTNKAKQHFQETQDAKSALNMMPNYKSRECMLLKALHRHGMDQEGCTKALLNIPYAMRQLYIHSYCSLLWNKMVSERKKLFGSQLVVGDLVLPEGTDRMSTREQVHTITEEDIEKKTFNLKDLVLPLPGNSIQYPKNDLGQVCEQYLYNDGLSKTSFRINALKINVPGDYRKVFACPKNLEYKVWQEVSCSETSTEEVNKRSKTTDSVPSTSNEVPRSSSTSPISQEHDIHSGNSSIKCHSNDMHVEMERNEVKRHSSSKIHAKLTFDLPASSYATVCVRELMKE